LIINEEEKDLKVAHNLKVIHNQNHQAQVMVAKKIWLLNRARFFYY